MNNTKTILCVALLLAATAWGQSFPGSSEDFILATGVNGPATVVPDLKPTPGGSTVNVRLESPNGTAALRPLLLAGELLFTSNLPSTPPLFSEIWVGSTVNVVLIVGPTSPVNTGVPLLPQGNDYSWLVPTGFTGFSFIHSRH